MLKLFLSLCFIISISFCNAQNKTATAITKTLYAQQDSWNKGDLEEFMQPYWHSDSLTFIGKSGITYGWQQTLDNYKKGYPNKDAMGKLEFTILKITQLSSRDASVIGKWNLTRTMGDVGGYFTLLWKKINGKWVIVQDHSS